MLTLLESLAAMGLIAGLSIVGGMVSIFIAEKIIDDVNLKEDSDDYIICDDGEKILYNEEDQE